MFRQLGIDIEMLSIEGVGNLDPVISEPRVFRSDYLRCTHRFSLGRVVVTDYYDHYLYEADKVRLYEPPYALPVSGFSISGFRGARRGVHFQKPRGIDWATFVLERCYF